MQTRVQGNERKPSTAKRMIIMIVCVLLLIGLVIGAVAKLIMPGKDPGGIIVTMLIGVAGSFLATWAGRAIGWYQEGQAAGFIMSVVGAIVLLGVYHMVKPKTT